MHEYRLMYGLRHNNITSWINTICMPQQSPPSPTPDLDATSISLALQKKPSGRARKNGSQLRRLESEPVIFKLLRSENRFRATNSTSLYSLSGRYEPYSHSVPSPCRLFKNSSTGPKSMLALQPCRGWPSKAGCFGIGKCRLHLQGLSIS